MVANLTVVLLCWFRTGRASLQTSNENRGERKPKPPATVCGKPSRWCGQSVQILLNYVGCEARKLPAGGEVFFLDFSFYRANRTSSYQDQFCSFSSAAESSALPNDSGFISEQCVAAFMPHVLQHQIVSLTV